MNKSWTLKIQMWIILFFICLVCLPNIKEVLAVPCDDNKCLRDGYTNEVCLSASSVCSEVDWVYTIIYSCRGWPDSAPCDPTDVDCPNLWFLYTAFYTRKTNCDAADRCYGATSGNSGYDAAGRVAAGICNDDTGACESGGWYKTCCTPPGVDPTTYCEGGRVDRDLCKNSGGTIVVGQGCSAAATVTPGGPTPTTAPPAADCNTLCSTASGSYWNNCSWCTDQATCDSSGMINKSSISGVGYCVPDTLIRCCGCVCSAPPPNPPTATPIPSPTPTCVPINAYVTPNPVNQSSSVTFGFTSNYSYNNVAFSSTGSSGCSLSNASCSGNIFDANSCWWRWNCTSSAVAGNYTGTFFNDRNCTKSISYAVITPIPTSCPAPNPVSMSGPASCSTDTTPNMTLSDGANTGCYPHNTLFRIWTEGSVMKADSNWASPQINTPGASVSWPSSTVLDTGKYYWRGRTANSAVPTIVGPTSPAVYFDVDILPPQPNPPNPPVCALSSQGADGTCNYTGNWASSFNSSLDLSCNKSYVYDFNVTDGSGNVLWDRSDDSQTTTTFTAPAGSIRRAKVRGKDGLDNWGGFSTPLADCPSCPGCPTPGPVTKNLIANCIKTNPTGFSLTSNASGGCYDHDLRYLIYNNDGSGSLVSGIYNNGVWLTGAIKGNSYPHALPTPVGGYSFSTGRYTWRTEVKNNAGAPGAADSYDNFDIDKTPPSIPSLSSSDCRNWLFESINTPSTTYGCSPFKYYLLQCNSSGVFPDDPDPSTKWYCNHTFTSTNATLPCSGITVTPAPLSTVYCRVKAEDNFGNVSTSSVVSKACPDPTNPTCSNIQFNPVSPQKTYTDTNNYIVVTWNNADNASLQKAELYMSGLKVGTDCALSGTSGSCSKNWGPTVSQWYTPRVIVWDTFGNTGECYADNYCVDSIPPNSPGVRPLSCSCDSSNPGKYKVRFDYDSVTSSCAALNTTPYRAQISANGYVTALNSDNEWQNDLVSEASNIASGTVISARARSRDGLDNQSAWSSPAPITVNSATCTCPILPPVCNAGPSCGQGNTVSMAWTTSLYATSYEYQVSRNSTFTDIVCSNSSTTSTWADCVFSPAPSAQNYYIRVRAKDGSSTSSWSNTCTASLDNAPPPAPSGRTLICKRDNATGKYYVIYSWDPVSDVGCINLLDDYPYWSQISTVSNFSSVPDWYNSWGSLLTRTSDGPEGLFASGTTIYARVQSRDFLNNQSGWSTPSESKTLNALNCDPLSAPTIIALPDCAKGTTINLSWTSVPGATVYYYELSKSNSQNADGSFTSILWKNPTVNTSVSLEILPQDLQTGYYYAHVRAGDGSMTSSWSNIDTAQLDNYAPNKPTGENLTCDYIPAVGAYSATYTWAVPSDVGCAGLHSTPYSAQIFPQGGGAGYLDTGWTVTSPPVTTTINIPEGKTIIAHVKTRDRFLNEAGWTDGIDLLINPANCGGPVVTSTPTPTPTTVQVAPVLSCIANNAEGSITWNWFGANPTPASGDYRIQVNQGSYSLNADNTFVSANTENSWKPPGYTDYTKNDGSPLTNDTYYGHVSATGGNPWSNIVSCVLSVECLPPNLCYKISANMCPVGSPQLDCASDSVCCEPETPPCTASTTVSCNKSVAYAGEAVNCTATSCSAPNICPWTSYLAGNSILSNSYANSGGPGTALGDTYPSANDYLTQNFGKARAEVITAQNTGRVDKIDAFIGWESTIDSSPDADYETVYIKIAKWVGGNNIVDFDSVEGAQKAITLNPGGAASCACAVPPCVCRWFTFDLGNANTVNEPSLTAGSDYIILMKRGTTKGVANPVYWGNDGFPKYPNRYRTYLRPPVDKSYGTYLPTSGGSTTWTVPTTAIVNEDWIVTARVYDAGQHCWGWGNNWPIKIVTAPTATPTPTASPTPTQGPWRKLKETSFQTTHRFDDNKIPAVPVAFDLIDDAAADPYFIIGDNAGVAAGRLIDLGGSPFNTTVSKNKWLVSDYPSDPKISFTKKAFLSYTKSRKEYKTISDIKTDITGKGIYYIDGGVIINVDSELPDFDFVLIVKDDVTINTASFNQAAHSIAILADKIIFSKDVGEARGIFVADNVNFGITAETAPIGLKIIGNVSGPVFTNNRTLPDNHRPSLFVVADPKQYLDLLQFLSIDKYDWRQLQ